MAAGRRIAVISAGTGESSATRALAGRLAQRALSRLQPADIPAAVNTIDLAALAADIATAAPSAP